MNNFCVNQGRGLKVSAAQLYPDFLCVPPPESKEVWWELKRGDCVPVQRVKIYHLAVLVLNSFSLCGRCKKERGRGRARGRGQKREREKGVP